MERSSEALFSSTSLGALRSVDNFSIRIRAHRVGIRRRLASPTSVQTPPTSRAFNVPRMPRRMVANAVLRPRQAAVGGLVQVLSAVVR